MRKVIHGTRPSKGLENHCALRSLFETAKRHDRRPHQFFLDLFAKTAAQVPAALDRKPIAAQTPAPFRC